MTTLGGLAVVATVVCSRRGVREFRPIAEGGRSFRVNRPRSSKFGVFSRWSALRIVRTLRACLRAVCAKYTHEQAGFDRAFDALFRPAAGKAHGERMGSRAEVADGLPTALGIDEDQEVGPVRRVQRACGRGRRLLRHSGSGEGLQPAQGRRRCVDDVERCGTVGRYRFGDRSTRSQLPRSTWTVQHRRWSVT